MQEQSSETRSTIMLLVKISVHSQMRLGRHCLFLCGLYHDTNRTQTVPAARGQSVRIGSGTSGPTHRRSGSLRERATNYGMACHDTLS